MLSGKMSENLSLFWSKHILLLSLSLSLALGSLLIIILLLLLLLEQLLILLDLDLRLIIEGWRNRIHLRSRLGETVREYLRLLNLLRLRLNRLGSLVIVRALLARLLASQRR